MDRLCRRVGGNSKRSPAIAYFKMAEAENLSGEFAKRKGWTKESRDAKVLRLVDIVMEMVPRRVSCTISNRDFDVYLRSLPVPERTPNIDKPYFLLSQYLMMDLAIYHGFNGIAHPTDFIFDEQGTIGLEAFKGWKNLKEVAAARASSGGFDFIPYLGSPPIFRDEKQFMPLQAADLYAWHVRRHFRENSILVMPTRPILNTLNSIPGTGRHLGGEDLRRMRFDLQVNAARLMNAIPPTKPLQEYKGSKAKQRRERVANRDSRRKKKGPEQ